MKHTFKLTEPQIKALQQLISTKQKAETELSNAVVLITGMSNGSVQFTETEIIIEDGLVPAEELEKEFESVPECK